MNQTNSTWLDTWLGLQDLSMQNNPNRLDWMVSLPAWCWAMIVLAVLLFAAWSYSRLLGKKWLRVSFSILRAATIILVILLLAGPVLIEQNDLVEPDVVLVMLDRSKSMTMTDAATVDSNEPLSRDHVLKTVLNENVSVFNTNSPQRNTSLFGFASNLYPLPNVYKQTIQPNASLTVSLDTPDGHETRLMQSIQQIVKIINNQPIAGIVVISDGRSADSISSQLITQLRERGISIYPIPLGSTQPPLDLAFGRVVTPKRAFSKDQFVVRAGLDLTGDSKNRPVNLTITDQQTGKIVSQQTWQYGNHPAELEIKTQSPGKKQFKLQASIKDLNEQILENNTHIFEVEIIDRPIRALYVEGYPRWEYRYLKNMLIREQSISSSMILVSADRAFAQEGDRPITRLPATRDEIKAYDVFVIGDVPAGYISSAELKLIKQHVSHNGAGLILIGGERWMPHTYERTILEDLLPMKNPAGVTRLAGPNLEWMMDRGDSAEGLGVLSLTSANDSPAKLPAVRWAQQLGELKLSSEVLGWWIADDQQNNEADYPAIVRMRYGAGQVLYVGTDELWRWRYGIGEQYFERFWIQMIRMLGRQRVEQQSTGVNLKATHSRIRINQQTTIELTVEDAAFDTSREQVRLAVNRQEAEQTKQTEELTLYKQTVPVTANTKHVYRNQFSKSELNAAGKYILTLIDEATGRIVSEQIEIISSTNEMQLPQADHDTLKQLAELTGGQIVLPEQAHRLSKIIPNRAIIKPNDKRESLAHAPLIFAMILVLLFIEWIGRKIIRLS